MPLKSKTTGLRVVDVVVKEICKRAIRGQKPSSPLTGLLFWFKKKKGGNISEVAGVN